MKWTGLLQDTLDRGLICTLFLERSYHVCTVELEIGRLAAVDVPALCFAMDIARYRA